MPLWLFFLPYKLCALLHFSTILCAQLWICGESKSFEEKSVKRKKGNSDTSPLFLVRKSESVRLIENCTSVFFILRSIVVLFISMSLKLWWCVDGLPDSDRTRYTHASFHALTNCWHYCWTYRCCIISSKQNETLDMIRVGRTYFHLSNKIESRATSQRTRYFLTTSQLHLTKRAVNDKSFFLQLNYPLHFSLTQIQLQ